MRINPLLTLISLLTLACSAMAAKNNVPRGLYYKESANGAIKIPAHTFTGRTTVSEFNLLFDNVKSYGLTLYQPSANIAITDHTPEFLLILDPSNNTNTSDYKSDWVFSTATSPAEFLLCKLHQSKQSRILKIGKSYEDYVTTIGPECVDHENLEVKQVSDNTYLLKPTSKLKNGQYAIVYTGALANDKIPPYTVFDFSIVNYTAETLERIKPGMLYSEVAEIMQFQPKKKKKTGNRTEWVFPGAGKVYFQRGAVVEVVPEHSQSSDDD